MCKAVNDYAKELAEKSKPEWILEGRLEGKIENAVETVRGMLKDGFDIEKALKYARIDLQTYEKYSKKTQ